MHGIRRKGSNLTSRTPTFEGIERFFLAEVVFFLLFLRTVYSSHMCSTTLVKDGVLHKEMYVKHLGGRDTNMLGVRHRCLSNRY